MGMQLKFGEVKVTTQGDQHQFEIQAFLDGIDPGSVSVQLVAGAPTEGTA